MSLLKDIENRAYASLNLSGNLSRVGSLSFNFILGTYTFDGLMLFSNADFSFFLGNNFIFSAGAEYASGLSDNNKILSFSPVTSRSVYSGLRSIDDLSYLAPNLGLTFVYNKLFAKLTEKTVISFGDDSKLFGLDSALSLKYNIFSDFQLGLSGALYFDFSESAYNNCSLTLSGGLEF